MNYTTNLNLKLPEGTDFYNIEDMNDNSTVLDTAVAGKVDKVSGKGLSTNDFTAGAKSKVDNLPDNTNSELELKADKSDVPTDEEKATWNAKANAETVKTMTLAALTWSEGSYSFESTYPVATYNISVELNGDSATDSQIEAWSSAKMVGSATSNVLYAKGDVPTVDIPVIIKAVAK